MPVKDTLRDFILNNFLFTDDQEALGDDDSFLGKGILDSTGIMEVILFVEDEFGLKVQERDMVPENFDSVNALMKFIERRRGG